MNQVNFNLQSIYTNSLVKENIVENLINHKKKFFAIAFLTSCISLIYFFVLNNVKKTEMLNVNFENKYSYKENTKNRLKTEQVKANTELPKNTQIAEPLNGQKKFQKNPQEIIDHEADLLKAKKEVAQANTEIETLKALKAKADEDLLKAKKEADQAHKEIATLKAKADEDLLKVKKEAAQAHKEIEILKAKADEDLLKAKNEVDQAKKEADQAKKKIKISKPKNDPIKINPNSEIENLGKNQKDKLPSDPLKFKTDSEKAKTKDEDSQGQIGLKDPSNKEIQNKANINPSKLYGKHQLKFINGKDYQNSSKALEQCKKLNSMATNCKYELNAKDFLAVNENDDTIVGFLFTGVDCKFVKDFTIKDDYKFSSEKIELKLLLMALKKAHELGNKFFNFEFNVAVSGNEKLVNLFDDLNKYNIPISKGPLIVDKNWCTLKFNLENFQYQEAIKIFN